jgi:hypothetical protein
LSQPIRPARRGISMRSILDLRLGW